MATKKNPDSDGEVQFYTEVFPAELSEINKRRNHLKKLEAQKKARGENSERNDNQNNSVEAAVDARSKPSTKLGLVGLAFSGGGIRSATFNLGAIQALAKNNLLKHIDYLSTVSGGGYIGSCLSSLLNSKATSVEWEPSVESEDSEEPKPQFPFYHERTQVEPVAIKHLRNCGNYLTPGGFVDTLLIPLLLLRGILTNFLILVPIIMLLAWVSATFFFVKGPVPQIFDWATQYYATKVSGGLVLLLWLPIPLLYRFILKDLRKRSWYNQVLSYMLLGMILLFVIESLPILLSYYPKTHEWDSRMPWLTLLSVVPYIFAGKASAAISKLGGRIALYGLGVLGPLFFLLLYLVLGEWALQHSAGDLQILTLPPTADALLLAAILIFVGTYFIVDVNVTSMHNFYRDRLSKAYLFQVDTKQDDITPNDGQKLSKLGSENPQTPYHLINAALNLQAGKDKDLRGRNADFFIFSKKYCGSKLTGYCATTKMEEAAPHLNLGSAMAISGAAAAPNMGSTTVKPLVFILTLLNIRLGCWLPNPKFLQGPGKVGYLVRRMKLINLWRELFSMLNEDYRNVNVSDGGHIENLGIYELLRRRCRFIIACDAEADPALGFGGLAKLIRYARIDMGIDIDIDIDDLRKNAAGLSGKHCACGQIKYGDGEIGYLLYVKSSVTGDENEYVREYRRRHPEFPHQSTGDQFFSEAQFEAYRALGYHIVNEMFQEQKFDSAPEISGKGAAVAATEDDSMTAWFENIRTILQPRFQLATQFVALQEQLGVIEQQFRDPEVAEYTYQIYPEIDPKARQGQTAGSVSVAEDKANEQFRKIFHLCNLQMQLMENVFVALQLDTVRNRNHTLNRGWMNLFQRWSHAPYFYQAWAVSIGTYGIGFQTFCKEALQLDLNRLEIQWGKGDENALTRQERDDLERYSEKYPKLGLLTPLERQDQIWIASMSANPDASVRALSPFPIGFVVIRVYNDNGISIRLIYYQIRDYYRQMRLFERMVLTMKESLKKNFPRVAEFQVAMDKAACDNYGHFFARHGFKIVIETAENEKEK